MREVRRGGVVEQVVRKVYYGSPPSLSREFDFRESIVYEFEIKHFYISSSPLSEPFPNDRMIKSQNDRINKSQKQNF